MKIHSTGGFWLFLGFCLLYTSPRLVLWLGAACLIHEIGHILAIRLMKGTVERIDLTGPGMVIHPSRSRLFTYREDCIIALAGPFFSFLLTAAAAAWASLFGGSSASLLIGLSFSLGLFNLLPIEPLDGGRFLRAASIDLLGPDRGESVCVFVSSSLIWVLFALGMAAVIMYRNFTILLCAGWLLFRKNSS